MIIIYYYYYYYYRTDIQKCVTERMLCTMYLRAVSAKEPVSEQVSSNVELICIVTDDFGTNYSVSWYKNGKQVGVGGGKKYQTEQTVIGSMLRVNRVKEKDVGEYQCTVTLGTGPARRTFRHVVNLFCTYASSARRDGLTSHS